METIQERLIQFIEYKGITPYRFCKNLGFSLGYLDKRGVIGTDKYLKIIEYYPEINPRWLLSGKGPMLQSELGILQVNESKSVYAESIPPVIDLHPNGKANVIVLPVKSAASDFTRALTDPVFYEEKNKYDVMYIPDLQYRPGPFFSTEIEGDSMHPTLTHSERLVGKPIPKAEFVGGYIHTLYHRSFGLLTKRLYWLDKIKHPGLIKMVSDNEDVEDQIINIDDVSPYILRGVLSVNFNLRNWNNDVRREIRELREEFQDFKNLLKK